MADPDDPQAPGKPPSAPPEGEPVPGPSLELETGALPGLVLEVQAPSKVRGIEPLRPALEDGAPIPAVVRVARAGYRPADITPVAELSAQLFTARLTADDIRRLEADAGVASVELSQALPAQKSGD